MTFFDTADAYGDGQSERLHRHLPAGPGTEDVVVGTKVGRRVSPSRRGIYTLESLRAWAERVAGNLGVDTLDLVQLHCPPSAVYDTDRVFDALDTLVRTGSSRTTA